MGKKLHINFNGELFDAEQPVLTAANRAFRYGDGLFESIRMIDRKIPIFDLHFDRLSKGMDLLKFSPSKPLTREAVKEQILELCEASGLKKSARVRLSVFRKSGGHYLPESNDIEYLIEAIDFREKGFELNEKGLKVDLYAEDEKPATIFSNYKTSNALIYVLAAVHKKKHKLDDCLLLNTKSRVIEAINSNLFIVREGELYTPPLQEGCVRGTMREYLLELTGKMGIPMHETPVKIEDLFQADEMFLSNAVTGIKWIEHYKIKEYSNLLTQKIHKELNNSLGIKV